MSWSRPLNPSRHRAGTDMPPPPQRCGRNDCTGRRLFVAARLADGPRRFLFLRCRVQQRQGAPLIRSIPGSVPGWAHTCIADRTHGTMVNTRVNFLTRATPRVSRLLISASLPIAMHRFCNTRMSRRLSCSGRQLQSSWLSPTPSSDRTLKYGRHSRRGCRWRAISRLCISLARVISTELELKTGLRT